MIQHRSILFKGKGRVFMAAGIRLNFHSLISFEEIPVVLVTCLHGSTWHVYG